MLLFHVLACLLAFLVATALLPLIILGAKRFHVLDHPDGDRKAHALAVPRLGGVAIFIGTATAVAAVVGIDHLVEPNPLSLSPFLPGMVIGCVILFITGLIDDVRGLRPRLKFIAQIVAALAVISYGFRVDQFTVTGATVFHLGILSLPITLLWIVGTTNAFNLIDGLDGLAGTFAAITLAISAAADLYLHHSAQMLISLAAFGAVLAFLRYNRHPAKIFLGDAGSMSLGFFLSIQSVESATTAQNVLHILMPLVALAYPLFDIAIAIARRWIRNRPLSGADRRHVHHQIQALGISPTRTVEILAAFFFVFAIMGIVVDISPPRMTGPLMLLTIASFFGAVCIGLRWLRYTEFTELGLSVLRVLLNARRHVGRKLIASDIASRLGDVHSLEEVGALLNDSAEELGLIEITLFAGAEHVGGPTARQISPSSHLLLRVDYPIAVEGPDGHTREYVLRLWCSRPRWNQYLAAERVASLLGPAVERWLQRKASLVPTSVS